MPASTTPAFPALTLDVVPVAVASGAWNDLAGVQELKELLDRRVVTPLRERRRAQRHGLLPPGAVLLFGPPGTGKSSLPRALAGRLGWALAEVDLSTGWTEAARLRALFQHLQALQDVVVFLDEFEQLGLRRDRAVPGVEPLTVELLRGLPALRANDRLLVVCATNYIRLLDPAVLRPGRFDLILPIGPCGEADRAQVLRQLLAERPSGGVDVERVAAGAEGLTTADLQAVCRRAAQAAFDREVRAGGESRIETADLLAALARYRPTLDPVESAAFRDDVSRFARL